MISHFSRLLVREIAFRNGDRILSNDMPGAFSFSFSRKNRIIFSIQFSNEFILNRDKIGNKILISFTSNIVL